MASGNLSVYHFYHKRIMKDREGALKIQQTLAETCEQYPAQQNMFQREYVRTMLDLCQDHNSRLQIQASSRCCRLDWSEACSSPRMISQDVTVEFQESAGILLKLRWKGFIGLIFLSCNFIPCSFKHLSHENRLEMARGEFPRMG